MLTKSVYILGGAGTGKSTFTEQLLTPFEFGPLEELHSLPNKKNVVTLRGHRIGTDGLYLGVMRENFPGTDGLDRASSPVGEAWLQAGEGLPRWLVAEGATLATRRFMFALAEYTDLLVLHLTAEEFIKDLRFHERGSNQDPKFVLATQTRMANLVSDLLKNCQARIITVNTADSGEWMLAMEESERHLNARED